MNHFFRVTLPGVQWRQALASCEEHLEFFWQPVSQLAEVNLQPKPVATLIESASPSWASTLSHGV